MIKQLQETLDNKQIELTRMKGRLNQLPRAQHIRPVGLTGTPSISSRLQKLPLNILFATLGTTRNSNPRGNLNESPLRWIRSWKSPKFVTEPSRRVALPYYLKIPRAHKSPYSAICSAPQNALPWEWVRNRSIACGMLVIYWLPSKNLNHRRG